jgi:hypothetical protein
VTVLFGVTFADGATSMQFMIHDRFNRGIERMNLFAEKTNVI